MKRLIGAASIVAILLAAWILFSWSRSIDQDSLVTGWAHSLIWQTLGLPVMPRFLDTETRPDPAEPGLWVVAGRMGLAGIDPAAPAEPLGYAATLGTVCDDLKNRGCWALWSLEVDGQALVTEGVPIPDLAGAAGAVGSLPPPDSRLPGSRTQDRQANGGAAPAAPDGRVGEAGIFPGASAPEPAPAPADGQPDSGDDVGVNWYPSMTVGTASAPSGSEAAPGQDPAPGRDAEPLPPAFDPATGLPLPRRRPAGAER